MSRTDLMKALEAKATTARVELGTIASKAGLSATIISRWRHKAKPPTLPTIGKLEDALMTIERERS